jgi:hypothetical protein
MKCTYTRILMKWIFNFVWAFILTLGTTLVHNISFDLVSSRLVSGIKVINLGFLSFSFSHLQICYGDLSSISSPSSYLYPISGNHFPLILCLYCSSKCFYCSLVFLFSYITKYLSYCLVNKVELGTGFPPIIFKRLT